jgi:hypothetical protein
MAGLLALAPDRAAPAEGRGEPPQDIILVIEVSASMLFKWQSNTKTDLLPNDPESIRWDAVQFMIDIARPEDRIAVVIFSGDAHVVTRAIDGADPSGLVPIGKPDDGKPGRDGRSLLKQAVTDMQAAEQKARKDDDYPVYTVNGKAFKPWTETSVICALRTVSENLLGKGAAGREGRETRVLLLTDGEDMLPSKEEQWNHPAPYNPLKTKAAYEAYLGELQKIKAMGVAEGRRSEALDGWVDRYVKPFREAKAPIFTFALGPECDVPLLEAVARLSRPADAHPVVRGDYRTLKEEKRPDSVQLLKQLQEVGWQLRQSWQLPVQLEKGNEEFETPEIGPWHDMGVLLYCRPAEEYRAEAPPDKDVRGPLARGEEVEGVRPLKSRSHWYYALSRDDLARVIDGKKLKGDEKLKFVIAGEKERRFPSRAVVSLRTREPLFEYRKPEGLDYTPLDAIPFEVLFTPYEVNGKRPFGPEDFEVEATVTPTPRPNGVPTPKPRTVTLAAAPEGGRGATPFRAKEPFVLDPDPLTTGHPELPGRYVVDVLITSKPTSLLRGAQLRLPPHTIEVGPYPAPEVAPPQIVVTNDKPELVDGKYTARGEFTAALKVRGAEGRNVATLRAALGELPKSGPVEVKGLRLSGERIELRDGRAKCAVELPAGEWAALAPGRYPGGIVKVAAPWMADRPRSVDVVVEKKKYNLESRVVELDLSRKEQPVEVTLKTALETSENVYLSTREDGKDPAEPKLELTQQNVPPDKAEVLRLPVGGLGKRVSVGRRGPAGGDKLSFSITPQSGVKAGLYLGKLYAVGDAVNPHAVTVQVGVDQAFAYLLKPNGQREELGGELDLTALADTDMQWTLQIGSRRDRTLINGLDSLLADQPKAREADHERPEGGRLPVALRPFDDRVTFDVKVPRSVSEGSYRMPLEFKLRQPRKPELLVNLLVKVDVAHAGAGPDVPTSEPLRLTRSLDSKPCDPTLLKTFNVVTKLDAPVRWEVKCVPCDPPVPAPAKPLPPELVKVFVQSEGQAWAKLWPADKVGFDTVSRGRPRPLKVEADCGALAPGLYRNRLVFRSDIKNPDDPDDPRRKGVTEESLDLEVLIPGWTVTRAECPGAASPPPGQPVEAVVELSCFDCEPREGDAGQLVPEDGGQAVPLGRGTRLDKPDSGSRLARYQYRAAVVPTRAGTNVWKVVWPPYCPDAFKPASPPTLEVRARGRIDSLPGTGTKAGSPLLVVYPNEEFLLRASLAPKALPPGQPLRLKSVCTTRANVEPTEVELFDDGNPLHGDATANDGTYSRKCRLPEPGRYEFRLGDAADGLELDRAEVLVGFDYAQLNSSGKFQYGGGPLLFWWPDHEVISVPPLVRLTNREAAPCSWRATLLYPTKAPDGVHGVNDWDPSNPDEASPTRNERLHFNAGLTCSLPEGKFTRGADGALSGELQSGESLEVGVNGGFLDKVRDAYYTEVDAQHPTLQGKNGMWVRLDLEWPQKGGVASQRTFYAPVTIESKSLLWAKWVSYVVALVFGVGLGWVVFWFVRRWLAARAAEALKPKAAPKVAPPGEKAAAEGAEPPPPPRPMKRPPGWKP